MFSRPQGSVGLLARASIPISPGPDSLEREVLCILFRSWSVTLTSSGARRHGSSTTSAGWRSQGRSGRLKVIFSGGGIKSMTIECISHRQ